MGVMGDAMQNHCVAAPGQALRCNGLKISWKSAGHCGSGAHWPFKCLEATPNPALQKAPRNEIDGVERLGAIW